MRLRNVKNKDEILNNSAYLIKNAEEYCGKWKELFGNDNPIFVEIGMGKGKFIIENALKYPDINFIGIEKFDSILARSLPKIPDGIKNLYIIRMDALNIDNVFDKEISRIYLNFSCPFPKKAYASHRLTAPHFLAIYEKIMDYSAEIHQKTDNMKLFEFSLQEFSQNGFALKNVSLDLHNSNFEGNIMTEYEEKFVLLGQPIYRLEAYIK